MPPTRKGQALDTFNDQLRIDPTYRDFLRSIGANPDGALKLSGDQRKRAEQFVRQRYPDLADTFQIDPAGNINTDHGLSTAWSNPYFRYPLLAGATIGTLGAAGAFSGVAGAAGAGGGASGAAGIGAGIGGASGAAGAAGAVGLGSTLLRYGLQYGAPLAGNLIAGKMASNAERESNQALMGYYDKALEAEQEERTYRRGWDEEGRRYDREFGEEGRNYGRYSDTYGRQSDEERLQYGRATDTYGRLSDEERLAYDRSQAIHDKNYSAQQYGNFVETLEPFRSSGTAATSRMSGLLGGPRPADTGNYLNLARTARESVQPVPTVPGRPTWDYAATRPTWDYPGASAGAARGADTPTSSGPGEPVGTTREVPWKLPVGRSPWDERLGGEDGAPTSKTPGQMVTVEAPDGERRQMPEWQAQQYIIKGARLVDGGSRELV